jgi:hypothetical protein
MSKKVGKQGEEAWTMELVEFGRRYYGLNRGGSYDAANKGLIPVIRVGRRWRGLPRVAERELAGETATAPNQPK